MLGRSLESFSISATGEISPLSLIEESLSEEALAAAFLTLEWIDEYLQWFAQFGDSVCTN